MLVAATTETYSQSLAEQKDLLQRRQNLQILA